METLELFYPQIAARAGPYTFDKGVEIEVYSSKSSYFDWAKIRFTEQFQPKISLARKDPAAIELGYNNVFEEVFTGYVSKPYNGGGFTDEVTLKDEMLLLEETQINNTFLDTTPQEMIAYFLGKAGLSKMKLSSKGYPERETASHSADERHRGDQCRTCSMEHQTAVFLLWGRVLLGREAGAGQDLHLRVWRQHHRPHQERRLVGARDGLGPLCPTLPQNQCEAP